jgi:hypothetical protein
LTAAEPRFAVEVDGWAGAAPRRIAGPIGLDGLFRIRDFGVDGPLAVKGRWLSDHEFEITSRTVGEGIATTHRLAFHGDEVDVSFTSNRGFTAQLHGTARD